jgi:imidazolonepropionase-like amidohydrolase
MRFRSVLLLSALALLPVPLLAQTAPTVGLRDNTPGFHALVGARVVTAPGTVIENATVVVRDGVIEAVGADVTPPAGARVWPLEGRTIYPGFIDAYTHVGMATSVPEGDNRGPVNWSPQVRTFTSAAETFADDGERSAQLRQQGFTTALALPSLGMLTGTSAVVSLDDGAPGSRVIRADLVQGMSLSRDNRAGGGYPTSGMGAITFLRQAFHDADWYDQAQRAWDANPTGVRRPERDRALQALVPVVRGNHPVLVNARDEDDFLRAHALASEFGLDLWIRGSGFEYRILEQVRSAGRPLILPINFPSAPNVATPEQALGVSLGALRHWNIAPENPGRLAEAGVEFALTADGTGANGAFLRNLRTAVERGLAEETALAALTTTPARMLGVDRTHGTIAAGKMANLVVVDGNVFEEGSRILDVWVEGTRFRYDGDPTLNPVGRWVVASLGSVDLGGEIEFRGDPGRLTGVFRAEGQELNLSGISLAQGSRRLTFGIPGAAVGQEGTIRLSATLENAAFFGFGDLPDGTRLNVRGDRTFTDAPTPTDDDPGNGNGYTSGGGNGYTNGNGEAPTAGDAFALHMVDGRPSFAPMNYDDLPPAMEFGRNGIPEQPEHVLVRNATIWTQGPQGRLENADLLVTRGRVVQVGQGLEAPAGARVIDATGKHVTPGLIDAHLHSGLSGGVNETGNAIVPEVRIGDVLTANNIWMYRQLAGGLTTAHVMHGSANPIGGQNQTVKMRWGALPEELKFEGAPRTVKFALGENVTRSQNRYPNTRMGVEQIIADHFNAAREYEAEWAEWERNRQGIPPRRDLRLEALRDILNGDISVQSHSYRQDEILMLMRLAEEVGFKVDAFHHGVEAYRVAPELAAHGAAAVVWSDWSSFKVEAYNATTYNVRLLLDAGVVTSLHSDDSQIASRMNWEAAKMLRTGVSEEEALNLVTLGTATVLGIADRVGSLEPGKDADFVIWSDSPLSTVTIAEQTWIDGRPYFDWEEDLRLRGEVEQERNALLAKIRQGR